MPEIVNPYKIEKVWRWRRLDSGVLRYAEEMVSVELTEAELQVQKR